MYEYDQWMEKANIVSIDREVELHVLQSIYVCLKSRSGGFTTNAAFSEAEICLVSWALKGDGMRGLRN